MTNHGLRGTTIPSALEIFPCSLIPDSAIERNLGLRYGSQGFVSQPITNNDESRLHHSNFFTYFVCQKFNTVRVVFIFLFSLFFGPALSQDFLFEENKGQWHQDVLFRTEIPGGYLFITKTGMKYLYVHPDDVEKYYGHHHGEGDSRSLRSADTEPTRIRKHAISVRFEGMNEAAEIKKSGAYPAHANYFIGNDPGGWATHVKKYEEVTLRNIYPDIDLKFYTQDGNLKYDLVIGAAAKPSSIKMRYEGADEINLKKGALEVKTSFGKSLELAPFSYQDKNNARREVVCKYVLKENTVSFKFPRGFDGDFPLVIDPTLIFSTYSGSPANNWGFTATFDDHGNLYSGGIVLQSGFLVTDGAFQENYGGNIDIGILKFDSLGENLLYATYVGGSEAEAPHSLIVDNTGNLVVLGSTSSLDFPVSSGAFQETFAGGSSFIPIGGVPYNNGSDLCLFKLSEDGSVMQGSSYLGGSANDGIMLTSAMLTKNYGDEFRGEVNLDADDNIYIASYTSSSDFPVQGSFQMDFGGGGLDGLVVKINPEMTDLVWSTYLGGAGLDGMYTIKIDTEKNVYVGGGTTSTDYPTTPGVYQEMKPSSGNVDGVITKINNDGNSVLASTYVGTSSYDQIYFIDLDTSFNIYALGQTQGAYPVSTGVYSNSNSGHFIHKFTSSFDSTYFSTVFGSGVRSPDIRPTAFLVNDCENMLISGWGGATNASYIGGDTHGLPITENAYQSTTDGTDFYLMVLGKDASNLLYGTFLGGNISNDHVDGGTSRFDKRGIVYQSVCAGCWGNSDFPTTPNAWSRVNGSSFCNNAVFKFDMSQLIADFTTDTWQFDEPGITSGCKPLEIVFLNKSIGGMEFHWDFGNGQTSTQPDSVFVTFEEPGDYRVVLTARDIATCIQEDSAVAVITVFDQNFSIMEPQSLCKGDDVVLDASGGNDYAWSPVEYLTNSNTKNPVARPDTTTYFKVEIINENGCVYEDSVLITVWPTLSAGFAMSEESACAPAEITFYNQSEQGVDVLWDFGNGTTSPQKDVVTVLYDTPGEYSVSLLVTDTASCPLQDLAEASITIHGHEYSVMDSAKICFGSSIMLNAEGGENYSWQPAFYLSNPDSKNPVASPDTTMYFHVAITSENGCVGEDSVLIAVVPDFTVDFSVSKTNHCHGAPDIHFSNHSLGAASFRWSLGDGVVVAEDSLVYNYQRTDTFSVVLTGFLDGCEKTKAIELPVVETLIPNVITPNGDGKNDTFQVLTTEQVDVYIFNRWGSKVFEQEDYQNDFTANDLSNGVYYYEVVFREGGPACNGWLHVLK